MCPSGEGASEGMRGRTGGMGKVNEVRVGRGREDEVGAYRNLR